MKSKERRIRENLNLALYNVSWSNYLKLLQALCVRYNHFDFVNRLHGFLRARDFRRLYDYADSLSAQMYADATQHFVANQFASLIRKYPFPITVMNLNPEENAKRTFGKAEHKCKRLNQRFRAYDTCRSPYEYDLSRVRQTIAYILGDCPSFSDVISESDFGPGASLGVHGDATNLSRKLISERWSVTPGLYDSALAIMTGNWQFHEFISRNADPDHHIVCVGSDLIRSFVRNKCQIVAHNKIAFVPKTAKTFRSIAVEPLINTLFQKGIDKLMRRKLKRFGIDLSDQSINSNLARIGSLNGTDPFVTIDLSSASDSISIGLVRNVMPSDWFDLLNRSRSESYKLGNKVTKYHKFCSMGNGFCFPLQTLLFTSACVVSGARFPGRDFHVYGDDIVVRRSVAVKLLPLLGVMGFTINSSKTFLSGVFRESCGRDWFGGEDVRPTILDFALDSVQNIIKFHNLTLRNERTSAFFEDIRPLLRDLIPTKFRFMRPFEGPMDSAFVVELDIFMSSPHANWNSSLQCWSWREYASVPLSDNEWRYRVGSDVLHMVAALRGSSSSQPFAFRRKVRTKVRRVAHSGSQSTWVPGAAVPFGPAVFDGYTTKVV